MTWIRYWLTNRKQRILLIRSELISFISVALQRAVLGFILYSININNKKVGLKSFFSKFADDTKISGKILTTSDCETITKKA